MSDIEHDPATIARGLSEAADVQTRQKVMRCFSMSSGDALAFNKGWDEALNAVRDILMKEQG